MLWIFSNTFWDYVYSLQFLHPKNHPKIITGLWKRCGIRQINFYCLKYMLMFLKKLLLSFFVTFVNLFEVMLSFYDASAQKKHPEIVTDPLNGCGILKICLDCLEYILRFPTKWLVKMNLLSLFDTHVKVFDKIVI